MMKNEIQRMLSASRALLILRLSALIFPVAFAAHGAEFLELGEITFDPPYLEADGRAQQVSVRVELLSPSPDRPTLNLVELIPADPGEEQLQHVVTLRNNGGGVFTGNARFLHPWCGVRRLRVTGGELASPTFDLPSKRAYLATAVFEPTRVVEPSIGHVISVGVDAPGQLIVTIDSGARLGVSNSDGINVSLDRRRILEVVPGADCIEEFIKVDRESDLLQIDGDGAHQQAGVRVDAVADLLELRVVEQPSLSEGRSVWAEAHVSALGLPVPDAEVRFSLDEATVTSTTDDDGVAAVSFPADAVGGSAGLRADVVNVVDPIQYLVNGREVDAAEIELGLEEHALVSIASPERRLALEAEATATVDLTIHVNAGARQSFAIDLVPDVVPQGLEVVQSQDVLRGVGPQTFVVRQTFRATQTGLYDVHTDALLDGQDHPVATVGLEVDVVERESGGRLVILSPVSDPPILQDSDVGQEVVFKAVVAGTAKPPEELEFDRLFEHLGDRGVELLPEPLGSLRDDGSDPDEVAGDLVYTGRFQVDGSPEERNLYRASSAGVESEPYAFEIVDGSSFPLTLVPPNESDEIVEEPGTGDRFAGNQLLVQFQPNVSPSRILEIIGEQEESLIGFGPILDIAQVTVSERDSDDVPQEAVRRLAASFATYTEVAFVEPNHEIELAQATGGYPDRASLDRVRAGGAWLGAGPNPPANRRRNLAVLDSQVVHPRLANSLVPGGPDPACTGNSTGSHGTMVAGVAAGIVGGADQGRYLLPVTVYQGTTDLFSAVICGLEYVAQHPQLARVVNLSVGFNSNQLSASRDEKNRLSRAVFAAITQQRGILVVAAAGNADRVPRTQEWYPASFPGGGLIAVANTNAQDQPYNGPDSTRRGPWVDVAAPGVGVTTLRRGGGLISGTGTSFSAPLVAGAASILWSRNPTATPSAIEQMLEGGAAAFAQVDGVGVGRLDAAEAVVNGSVELDTTGIGSPASWLTQVGQCRSIRPPAGGSAFYRPQHGRRFLRCDGAPGVAAEKRIEVAANVARLRFVVRIAAFASPPPPTIDLEVGLQNGGGDVVARWAESLASTARKCAGFVDSGGNAIACSDWRRAVVTVPNPAPGVYTLVFRAGSTGRAPLLLLDRLVATVVPR